MEIKMPKLGLTMTEGTISSWLVQTGQTVSKGEILFEFESEKSIMEFESPADGTITDLLVPAGTTVPCGTPLAVLETALQHKAAKEPATAAKQKGVVATPAAKRRARELDLNLENVNGRGPQGRIHLIDVEEQGQSDTPEETIPAKTPPLTIEATPLARRLANDLAVDLNQLTGSGPNGRIIREDVLSAARQKGAGVTPTDKPQENLPAAIAHKEPLRGVRSVIARRMSDSASTAAHVTLHTEVDATNLVLARQQLNEELQGAAKISYNALLVAIAARTLHEQPPINSCLVDNEIITYADINIGLAVDSERGLLVPVIKNADKLGVVGIQEQGDALIQRALAGKSTPDDLNGGTFTITNLGMFGIDAFTPIINQPQAAILGVGRIVNKPVNLNGELALRDRLTLSLSFDHRLVDGAPAARFLQRIGQLVERPLALLIASR